MTSLHLSTTTALLLSNKTVVVINDFSRRLTRNSLNSLKRHRGTAFNWCRADARSMSQSIIISQDSASAGDSFIPYYIKASRCCFFHKQYLLPNQNLLLLNTSHSTSMTTRSAHKSTPRRAAFNKVSHTRW
jgi:hypothetical protein